GVRRTWPSIRAATSRTSAIPITIPPWAKLGSAFLAEGKAADDVAVGHEAPATRPSAAAGAPARPFAYRRAPQARYVHVGAFSRAGELFRPGGGSPFRRGHARLLACVHR